MNLFEMELLVVSNRSLCDVVPIGSEEGHLECWVATGRWRGCFSRHFRHSARGTSMKCSHRALKEVLINQERPVVVKSEVNFSSLSY
jgi:hypothetical protein